jgi:hypothetical protein
VPSFLDPHQQAESGPKSHFKIRGDENKEAIVLVSSSLLTCLSGDPELHVVVEVRIGAIGGWSRPRDLGSFLPEEQLSA